MPGGGADAHREAHGRLTRGGPGPGLAFSGDRPKDISEERPQAEPDKLRTLVTRAGSQVKIELAHRLY